MQYFALGAWDFYLAWESFITFCLFYCVMALLGRLKFWKKEEVPDFPEPEAQLSPEAGIEPFSPLSPPAEFHRAQPPELPRAFQQGFQQPGLQSVQVSSDQQLQLISSKLDTIKAQLDVVIQRLDRLERKDETPYQQRWRNA